jgi:hypothetical protein
MIRLDESGPVRTASDAEWERGRRQFAEEHHLRFPGFIAPALLDRLQKKLRSAVFLPKQHGDIANELACYDSPVNDTLCFLCNDPRLFAMLADLTGIQEIRSYLGRLYRMTPHEHHDSWHSDVGEDRLIAMSVNLSEEPYLGGALILGDRDDPSTERRIDNSGPGDALLFRIDPRLHHYVEDVKPGPNKTAWAGWFQSKPDFMDVVTGKFKL